MFIGYSYQREGEGGGRWAGWGRGMEPLFGRLSLPSTKYCYLMNAKEDVRFCHEMATTEARSYGER